MLKDYLKIAWRNITRHKTYAFINILGLSLGICTCVVIFLICHYELSADTFHPGKERIYRVGEVQFTDFSQGKTTFGDLTRNIFHEYQHILNGYASNGHMEAHEDEFRAHWATLSNKTLPSYSQKYGQLYTKMAEGYYNVMPDKTPEIKNLYRNLVNFIKPSFGLPKVANPSQLPPVQQQRGADGKLHNVY